MAEITDASTKGADHKTAKTAAANIHENPAEHDRVPEHIEGTSQTPEHITDEILNPPEANEDEVKGEDNSPIAEPHSADPQADPEDRHSRNAEEIVKDETHDDGRLKLKRVNGDDVYGSLGAPPSTVDSLKQIRDREDARPARDEKGEDA